MCSTLCRHILGGRIADGQKERLMRELDQLEKTYKAGIINEKEFEKGRERINAKLDSIVDQEKKAAEGKRIVEDVLGERARPEEKKPAKEPAPKPRETKPEKEAAEPEDKEPATEEAEEKVDEVFEKKESKPAKPKAQKKKKKAPAAKPKKKKQDEDDYEEDSVFSKILIFAAIVFVLLLLVLSRTLFDGGEEPVPDLAGVNETVTMQAYMDYTCEHSAAAWDNMVSLKTDYGDNLVIALEHFPMDDKSLTVANAVQCAFDQGRHIPYIERILANQEGLDADRLKNYAWAEGLDVFEFNDCVDDMEHLDEIRSDLKEGYEKGVRGTPSFFVGEEMIEGNQAEGYFRKVINEHLGVE